mgnify:FL=1
MTNPFQRSRSYRTVTQSLILCAVMCLTLATPVTLHVSQQDVPEVSPQEQQKIVQEYICLKTALYHEARGEPIEGIKAVLSIIQNRKNHKDYPSTYCGVIKQPYQFSFYNTIKHDRTAYSASEAKVRATIASLAFEAAVGRFKGTLDPSVVMYHAKNIKNLPAWSTRAKFVVTIQNHQFYRS